MKRLLPILFILSGFPSSAQSVFGYWYGNANVKTVSSANNYLVELVLQPEKNHVKGLLNYYFKNTYRSLQVKGNYNAATRQLTLYDVPVVYHGSHANLEVDCIMNLHAVLRVSQVGSTLTGSFLSLPDYKNVCQEIGLSLSLNADISKKDSVLKAISEYKEEYQVWKPAQEDTIVAVTVTERKVINYVTERQYKERENVLVNEFEIESDSLEVSLYDNGEIDGDMISVFYNGQLILYNQKLTHKSIKLNLKPDSTREYNEISMFAENLGLIPPNTALMIVQDGKKRYEVRLTSNLDKNATIRFRKKKE